LADSRCQNVDGLDMGGPKSLTHFIRRGWRPVGSSWPLLRHCLGVSQCLRRERYGSHSGERAGELSEDRPVGRV